MTPPKTSGHADMKVEKTQDGLLLEIHVKPRARRFSITATDDELVVACTQPPVDGKANRELIKKLSKIFGKVTIVSGFHSSTKKILLRAATAEKALKILEGIRNERQRPGTSESDA